MTKQEFNNLNKDDTFIYDNDFDGCNTIITIYDFWEQSDYYVIESTSSSKESCSS